MAAKKINKDFFLLLKIYEIRMYLNIDEGDIETYLDKLFDEYVELYYDFVSSDFNNDNRNKLDCIKDYVNSILN